MNLLAALSVLLGFGSAVIAARERSWSVALLALAVMALVLALMIPGATTP